VCVEDLVEKQNKTTLFKVTEPSSVPYRTPPACAKRAAYPDPPPVMLHKLPVARPPAGELAICASPRTSRRQGGTYQPCASTAEARRCQDPSATPRLFRRPPPPPPPSPPSPPSPPPPPQLLLHPLLRPLRAKRAATPECQLILSTCGDVLLLAPAASLQAPRAPSRPPHRTFFGTHSTFSFFRMAVYLSSLPTAPAASAAAPSPTFLLSDI